jgi:transaldolase
MTGDDSYLRWLVEHTQTRFWHDSGDPEELGRALAQGASGVTTNPILTAQALKAQPGYWRALVGPLDPALTPEEKAIALTHAVARHTAARLEGQHRSSGGVEGFVCAQVNPSRAGDRSGMLSMARRFHAWAPNIAVKLPVTAAGLDVLEDCVAAGITVTATVSFTVPQVLAVAERHRHAAARATAAGRAPGRCFAVIMIGRLDDYLREVAGDNRVPVSEEDIRQAGLAVVKRAYSIFLERDYQAVLLVAALRGAYHMTGLAGGKLVVSVHPKVQAMLPAPEVPRSAGIDRPIDAAVIRRLRGVPDFSRAYDPDGMRPEEFITYGVTQRTLSSFVDAGWGLLESGPAA